MIIATLALTLALAQGQDTRPPLKQEGPTQWSDPLETTDAGRLSPSTPQALRTIQQFGACIADTSTTKARDTLSGDFTSRSYRTAMDRLVDANRGCASSRGWSRLRSSRLLLAGAIAERLIEQVPTPVNVQLARAATKPAAKTYSATDAGAMCVVRSAPDEVGALFASDVASSTEQTAAGALKPVMKACLRDNAADISVDGLRAMLATAAYRSIGGAVL